MKKPIGAYLAIGALAFLSLALTTDQIIQAVYNSSAGALTVKVVGGSGPGTGTVTGSGTSPRLAAWSSSSALTNYGGDTTCTGQNALQQLTNAGVGSCVAIPPSGGTVAAPVAIVIANAGTTGTTASKLVKIKTDGTAVITATTDTVGAIGIALASDGTYAPGTTGSVKILLIGVTTCVFDNAVTSGDFIGISSGTAGDCTDLGSTFPSDKSVLGIVLETNGSAGTRSVLLSTPDIMNTTNIKGGNPGKGNITNLSYSGLLNASDWHSQTTSGTVAHRFEVCGSGASGTVTMTLPASPAVGDIYTLVQRNASQLCVFARAGSQTIDGATSATLSAGVAIGKDCTVVYVASNDWHASGACT